MKSLFSFCYFKDLFISFMYLSAPSACTPAYQKRASDPITDDCELPFDCWELNSGPLEQQPVLFTTEPPLQPIFSFFFNEKKTETPQSHLKQCKKWSLHCPSVETSVLRGPRLWSSLWLLLYPWVHQDQLHNKPLGSDDWLSLFL